MSAREVVARALHEHVGGNVGYDVWLAHADIALAALAADPGVVEQAARALCADLDDEVTDYGRPCSACSALSSVALAAALTPGSDDG